MAQLRPTIGLGVFVFRSPTDLRFVFGRRKGSLGSGTYSLAGGHLEMGETFEQGAKREVLEETGLEIERVGFLTAVENLFEGADGGRHYVTVFMTAFAKGDGPGMVEARASMLCYNLEPEKCEGWEWWSVKELRERRESAPETLFLPMRNLYEQRPEVAKRLEDGKFE